MITMVPAGTRVPPKSSSSSATRVTTGTTEYSRRVSLSAAWEYSKLANDSRVGSVPWSSLPKTRSARSQGLFFLFFVLIGARLLRYIHST